MVKWLSRGTVNPLFLVRVQVDPPNKITFKNYDFFFIGASLGDLGVVILFSIINSLWFFVIKHSMGIDANRGEATLISSDDVDIRSNLLFFNNYFLQILVSILI